MLIAMHEVKVNIIVVRVVCVSCVCMSECDCGNVFNDGNDFHSAVINSLLPLRYRLLKAKNRSKRK